MSNTTENESIYVTREEYRDLCKMHIVKAKSIDEAFKKSLYDNGKIHRFEYDWIKRNPNEYYCRDLCARVTIEIVDFTNGPVELEVFDTMRMFRGYDD